MPALRPVAAMLAAASVSAFAPGQRPGAHVTLPHGRQDQPRSTGLRRPSRPLLPQPLRVVVAFRSLPRSDAAIRTRLAHPCEWPLLEARRDSRADARLEDPKGPDALVLDELTETSLRSPESELQLHRRCSGPRILRREPDGVLDRSVRSSLDRCRAQASAATSARRGTSTARLNSATSTLSWL